MSNELLIALISGASSLGGAVIGVFGSAKILTYRVSQLEEKMQRQCENCVLMDGRVDKIEKEQAVMNEKIHNHGFRINALEKSVKT